MSAGMEYMEQESNQDIQNFTRPAMPTKLLEAMVKAQAEFRVVKKNKTANGGTFSYSYASLDEVNNACDEALTKHGLYLWQHPHHEGGKFILTTVLCHTSGEYLPCGDYIMLPAKDTEQGRGSALTYARRYTKSTIFGVAAEDDDDGKAASTGRKKSSSGNKPKGTRQPSGEKAKSNWRGKAFDQAAKLGIEDKDMLADLNAVLGLSLDSRSKATEAQWKEYHTNLKQRLALKEEEEREPMTPEQKERLLELGGGDVKPNTLRLIAKRNVDKLDDLSADEADWVKAYLEKEAGKNGDSGST